MGRLHDFIDRWRRPSGWRLGVALLLVAGLLLACGLIVYATGGTRNVFPHLAYFPVVLGALWFRAPGGILAALAAGLLLGPFMPLDVASGSPQRLAGWLYRTCFFVMIGGFVGQMSFLLNTRLDKLHRAMASLATTYAHTLKTFASLVALRDEQTGGHCERVAHNACVIGEQLGLDKVQLDTLYWAGILHDLGKVATPAHILLKPGKLTEAEYGEIKKHAAEGAELLMAVSDDFAGIAAGVRSHHERWDGKGYPDGLAGEDIPLFGRILGVVDVFEALTSERPYRGPMSAEEALSYMTDNAGSHFDPAIVPAFESALNRGLIYVSGRDGFMTQYDVPIRFSEEAITVSARPAAGGPARGGRPDGKALSSTSW